VDRDEARRLLQVTPGAGPAELRAAFRREIRRLHPDATGVSGHSVGAAMTELIAAYRELREPEVASVRAPVGRLEPRPVRVQVNGDTLLVHLPAGQLWPIVLDVAHGLGEVAYVDRSVPVVETIVEFLGHPVCSVLLSVDAHGDGTSELSCAAEALGGDRAPPGDAVARLVADRLADYES
jgi:hypothetical protein